MAVNSKILVLGLGNTILTDDGVGIYVARHIRKKLNVSNVDVKEASVGGLELLDLIQGYDKAVLIDAMVTRKHSVGTLFQIKPDELKGGSAMDRHHISLPEALGLGDSLKMNLPRDLVIYGIEVDNTYTFGEKCTSPVEKAIPGIASHIISEQLMEPML